jgi:predicted acetyltransferase
VTALDVRPIEPDQYAEFLRVDHTAFGWLPTADDLNVERLSWPLDRSVACFIDGAIVGCAGDFPFEITLPGLTSAPTAGVTAVGVLPTHRRRGVLTSMMRHQLDAIHARGDAIAILLASESIIYGRFGYGLATVQAEYELPRQYRDLARPFTAAGRMKLIDDDEARKVLPDIHERVRLLQPGDVSRNDGWWQEWFRRSDRAGNTGPRFCAVYEGSGGEVEGFATYRVGAGGQGNERAAMVQSMGALNFDAYVALWQYITDIDLTVKTTTMTRPLDEPYRYLLADPRRLRATHVGDYLWCRVVDVGAALPLRRYAIEGRVVLDVRDAFCPWNEGRWVLEGGPGGATCTRGDKATPDVTLSAADLGAAYLGGTSLLALARAQRVTEQTPGALERAALMFTSDPIPYCQTHF